MWFLWGLLMWFGCHYALNMCLSFSTKYKKSKDGLDLYVAIGTGVACLGATIFAFSSIDKEVAFLIGSAIGFLTGGIHFYSNVKSGELQRVISQSNRAKDDELKEKIETLKSILENDEFSQKNKAQNTILNSDFTEINNINVDVQLKKLPKMFFDDPDGKIANAIEAFNNEFIDEVYEMLHQEAVDNYENELCVSPLLGVDILHDEIKGWQFAFLECLAKEQYDCFYIILALSSDGKTMRYFVAALTSSKTNQFGYGIGEMSEVNPDDSSISHGKTSTNYFDVVNALELALSKPNPKAKKVSSITSTTSKTANKKTTVQVKQNEKVEDDKEGFAFEIGKVYPILDLEKRITTSTGHAQHIGLFELMLEGLKVGAEDIILDRHSTGDFNGKQKPILEILYLGVQQKAQKKYGEKLVEKTPIELIHFNDSPKSATITFINPKVNESRTITLASVELGEITIKSLFRMTETLDAEITIKKNRTFTVTSYKDLKTPNSTMNEQINELNKELLKKWNQEAIEKGTSVSNETKLKLSKMFNQSFDNCFCCDQIMLSNIPCNYYLMMPSINRTIGQIRILVETLNSPKRFFTAEYSYNDDIFLCEWVFDNGIEIKHLNYGTVVNNLREEVEFSKYFYRKIEEILSDKK